MRTSASAGLVALFLLALTAAGREAEKGEVKCNIDHLEKAFGLKVKSVKLVNATDSLKTKGKVDTEKTRKQFQITLAFDKDIEDTKDIKAAFRSSWPRFKGDLPPKLYFYLFDGDNVSLMKALIHRTEGELTGKKGDAFRVLINSNEADYLAKVRKIEVRPVEPPKKP